VRERFYDRDGVLGWSRAEESAVSCAESKSGDKRNPPRLKEGKNYTHIDIIVIVCRECQRRCSER